MRGRGKGGSSGRRGARRPGVGSGTSVDEQDVILVDGPVDHIRIRLPRQQVLVEPLASVLKRLRRKLAVWHLVSALITHPPPHHHHAVPLGIILPFAKLLSNKGCRYSSGYLKRLERAEITWPDRRAHTQYNLHNISRPLFRQLEEPLRGGNDSQRRGDTLQCKGLHSP